MFTLRDGVSWPMLAAESESANWWQVDTFDHHNDYAWDFYKLFGRKTAAGLFVGRVAGKADDNDVEARIQRLSGTLIRDVYDSYGHLLYPCQPILVALVPRSSSAKARIGAAVAPGPFKWMDIAPENRPWS